MAHRMVKTLGPVEAAYIAGLMDGEGTVTLSRRNRNKQTKGSGRSHQQYRDSHSQICSEHDRRWKDYQQENNKRKPHSQLYVSAVQSAGPITAQTDCSIFEIS